MSIGKICRLLLIYWRAHTFVLVSGMLLFLMNDVSLAQTKGQGYFLFEIAPLKSIISQVSLRGERSLKNQLSYGLSYENTNYPGRLTDRPDRRQNLVGEGVWYFNAADHSNFFLAGGLVLERGEIGAQQERDALTWARTNSDEAYDRWVNHETNLLLQESIGFRFNLADYLTAAIRLDLTQKALTEVSTKEKEIRSDDLDTSAARSPATRKTFGLFAGVVL